MVDVGEVGFVGCDGVGAELGIPFFVGAALVPFGGLDYLISNFFWLEFFVLEDSG